MLILGGLFSIMLLGIALAEAKRRGLTGGKIALIAVVGAICIVVLTFGILVWGFSGFG